MNCHRCKHLKYDGSHYGRCSHPAHPEVVFVFKKDRKGKGSRKRPYNKGVCEDFKMIRKCSLCRYWERGKYHRDGKTPSVKGRCILSICSLDGNGCPMWDKATKRKVVSPVSIPRDAPSDAPVVRVVG